MNDFYVKRNTGLKPVYQKNLFTDIFNQISTLWLTFVTLSNFLTLVPNITIKKDDPKNLKNTPKPKTTDPYKITNKLLNPYYALGLFLYPMKASDVFRRYRKRPVAKLGLKTINES